jgi:branched-subunit amino acid aminotransferase/4-amino-4-deoxychorismate lyase
MQLDGSAVGADELATLALYNYGHFTTMLVHDMKVRGLGLHMQRLVDDSNTLHGIPVDPDRVRDLVRKALTDGPETAVARVTVFAPDLDMARPDNEMEPRVLVTTRAPAPDNGSPMRVKSVLFHRDLPAVKHVGLFGQISQRRTARQQGFDDALFVGADSSFVEGATWNIGFLRAGEVVWPEASYLAGVTMRLLQSRLDAYGVVQKTHPVVLADLDGMDGANGVGGVDGAFATNAAIGVRPISAIDDHELTVDSRCLDQIREAYLSTPAETL